MEAECNVTLSSEDASWLLETLEAHRDGLAVKAERTNSVVRRKAALFDAAVASRVIQAVIDAKNQRAVKGTEHPAKGTEHS